MIIVFSSSPSFLNFSIPLRTTFSTFVLMPEENDMNLVSAVIFDLDGVLLDTERLSREAWQWALSQFGFTLSNHAYELSIGRTVKDTCNLWRERFGAAVPAEEANALRLRYIDEHLNQLPSIVKPGVQTFIDHLDSAHMPLAVATSSDQSLANRKLEAAGLSGRFSTIVSGDQVSKGKPSPEIYLEAAARLSVEPSRCLVFEDADDGVRAAHSAGMSVVIVPDLKKPSNQSLSLASAVLSEMGNAVSYMNTLAEQITKADR